MDTPRLIERFWDRVDRRCSNVSMDAPQPGATVYRMAKELGVQQSTLGSAVNGRTWRRI